MKLSRKNLGRVATTFLATAMLASLTAVPAFATEDPTGVGDYTDDPQATVQVDIYKDITKPDNVFLPNETFEFTINTYGYEGEGEAPWADGAVIDTANSVIDSAPGDTLVTGLLGYSDTEIAANKTGNNHTVRLNDTVSIDLTAANFGQPGEYQFLITETAGTYETGLDYGAQNLILNVIVVRGTGVNENTLYIAGYELFTTTTAEGGVIVPAATKTDAFHNNYAINGEGEDQTYDYDLTKQVTGDFATPADEAKHYEFKITITNSATDNVNKKYAVTMSHEGNDCAVADRKDITEIVEGTETTFKLAEGDTFHIDGLTANDQIVIKETTAEGFVTTYKTVKGDSFEGVTEVSDIEDTIEKVDGDYMTEFTNTKNAVSPTGIAMDIAPYALLVVIAAAGCFVFLRKRNED